MANLIIVADADRPRCKQIAASVALGFDGIANLRLVRGGCEIGDVMMAWIKGETAPFSFASTPEAACVLFGDAIDRGRRVDADTVLSAWCNGTLERTVFDGYYCIACVSRDGRVWVGVDRLGLFPVYYSATDRSFLIASNPEPILQAFSDAAMVSAEGLCGILLTGHLFRDRPLLKTATRLAPGKQLVRSQNGDLHEQRAYEIKLHDELLDLPFTSHIAIMEDVLREAFERHLSDSSDVGLLLSGGRDSRLYAGLLAAGGCSVRALTFGRATDFEVKSATEVARVLDFEHRFCEIDERQAAAWATTQVVLEHLSNGFSTVPHWGELEASSALPQRTLFGILSGPIVGGCHLDWALNDSTGRPSIETFIGALYEWAFTPSDVIMLWKRRSHGEALVNNIVGELKTLLTAGDEPMSRVIWRFDLAHRTRFIVGAAAWRLSFATWPVIPLLDEDVLTTFGSIPPSTMAQRRGQDELLCTRFMDLADIPLATYLRLALEGRIGSLRFLRTASCVADTHDRLHRLSRLDGTLWRSVAELAEPELERLGDLLDYEYARSLFPSDEMTRGRVGLQESAGVKVLLGLALWLKHSRRDI